VSASEPAEKMPSPWELLDERDRLRQQAEAMRDAIDNEMVTAHIGVFDLGDDPRKALHKIISWHVMVALDPSVSSSARELIERGRAEAGADAENYRWIRDNVREVPLRPDRFGAEVMPDTRLCWELPVLVSLDAIGQQISLDEAIEAARGRGS
jgi:hypothetical protein